MNFWNTVAVVTSVVAACLLSCTLAVATCKEGQTNTCYNCTTMGTCTKAGESVAVGAKCTVDQACIIENGAGVCKPINGTQCACTHLTYSCDLYDPVSVTECLTATSIAGVFAPEQVFACTLPQKCISGKCAEPETKPEKCTKDNVNQRYIDPNNCKKYFTCREKKRNQYDYMSSQCPFKYVFNPENKYCDLPANVPGCP